MVSREEAYDRIQQCDNLVMVALSDLRDSTRKELKKDLKTTKGDMIEMRGMGARTNAEPAKVQEMIEQREISIEKIEDFDKEDK